MQLGTYTTANSSESADLERTSGTGLAAAAASAVQAAAAAVQAAAPASADNGRRRTDFSHVPTLSPNSN